MTGVYNFQLVALSLVVAIIASYTALELAGRVSQKQGKSSWIWLVGGAVSMGTGIWSMHFIGMLAFHLPVAMAYDATVTMLSMAIAIVVSGLALFVVRRPTLTWQNITAGATLMGIGISAMHYTGMHAMQMWPPIEYHPPLFIASVIIATVASFVALWIAFQLRHKTFGVAFLAKLGSATVMGLAITGMHYTGMAAAQFAPDSICLAVDSTDGMKSGALALSVGIATICILVITLVISALDAQFAAHIVLEQRISERTQELRQANELLQQAVRQHQLVAERAEYLAYYDSLTALPNRSMFSKLLNQAISLARRNAKQLAVLFVDLDRFKNINDTLGHEAGDLLLQEVGKRLKACLRESDTVARLGGDEFVVLLPVLHDAAEVEVVARKILAATSRSFVALGQECRVTTSVGASTYPQDGEDEQTLMKNADIAMYQAKEDGKNNFQFYSVRMNTHSFERLALESSLRRALEHDEFQIHYQPKIDARSGGIVGTEALLRWQHPELGMVAPAKFIPIAEESGLIVSIGKWVLKTACTQNVAWQQSGLPRLTMAVNLSRRQFSDDGLLRDITSILEETGMSPELLELEITESTIMHDVDRAMRTLKAFKDMGVRLAIDDFGTGYSSLFNLKQFPIDTIKIDGSFVHEISSHSENRGIAEAIIAMGKTLSLTVIAEGVETKAQADFLRAQACDEFQGFYFSKAVTAGEFAELLEAQAAIAAEVA